MNFADVIDWDRRSFLYLNQLGSASFDQFWILISQVWIWIPFYCIIFYFVIRNFPARSVIYILIFLAIGVAFCDQLANIFKNGILRLRPCHDPELMKVMRTVKCGGNYGFFSAHAANTFFLATFLSKILTKKFLLLILVLFFWACVVSYSRIYLGMHFPLDILMGAGIGILSGGMFSEFALKTICQRRP